MLMIMVKSSQIQGSHNKAQSESKHQTRRRAMGKHTENYGLAGGKVYHSKHHCKEIKLLYKEKQNQKGALGAG